MTIPLKAWVIDEAKRVRKSRGAIYARIARGKYPYLPLKRLNMRVVLVELDKMQDWLGEGVLTDTLNDRAGALTEGR